jgi:hypothetical protein
MVVAHGTGALVPLTGALSTPWHLTLAATVYDQRDPATGMYLRDPADLTGPALDTQEKIRDHLLSLFIPAAIATHPGRYPADRVYRHLAVLAAYLQSNAPTGTRPARKVADRTLSATDLILHELWPLAGTRTPRIVTAALITVVWLGYAAWQLTHIPIGFIPRQIIGATGGSWAAFVTIGTARMAWPYPSRAELWQLMPQRGPRPLVAGLVGGLTWASRSRTADL